MVIEQYNRRSLLGMVKFYFPFVFLTALILLALFSVMTFGVVNRIVVTDQQLVNKRIHIESASVTRGGFIVVENLQRASQINTPFTVARSGYLYPGKYKDFYLNIEDYSNIPQKDPNTLLVGEEDISQYGGLDISRYKPPKPGDYLVVSLYEPTGDLVNFQGVPAYRNDIAEPIKDLFGRRIFKSIQLK